MAGNNEDVPTGNIVIAGDAIVAGVDFEDTTEIPLAMVVQFESREDYAKALKSDSINVTLFK